MALSRETEEVGRSPLRGSGHSAEPEPCSTVSAVPASVLNAGSFIVYETGSSFRPHASGLIASLTPKLARLSKSTNYDRQIYRGRIVAVFDSPERAEQLEQALRGAYGEFSRRRSAADAEHAERVATAYSAFKKVAGRLVREAEQVSA
jgi:hypothetical protein